MRSYDDSLPMCVVLWPASTAEALHDIQHAHIHETPLLWVVYLGSLDDYSVRRQIHTPCQCGGAYKNFCHAFLKPVPLQSSRKMLQTVGV